MPSARPSKLERDDDPLSRAIAPPPDETPAARAARLQAEQDARTRSDAIDEEINRQRLADKKSSRCVRLLLLGQSESGKSTTLKNFQLLHSPKAFKSERISWRAVVHLNVVRSIRLILDALSEAQAQESSPNLTPELLKLKMRLLPLQQVEEALLRKLAPAGSADFEATHLSPVTNLPYTTRSKEIAVNSATAWKGAFSRILATNRASMDESEELEKKSKDPNEPGVVLNACAEDMVHLWDDETVKKILRTQRIRLEDMAGFFLDSIKRVTALNYVPTDDDILRARLKTLGVSEHRFRLQAGNLVGHDWRVFDVGGARSLRAAWIPFFDNVDAIIFLAPISCFDQVLAEDPTVNRLEDSILLWKAVVSNKLLKDSEIVIFLNKIDILKDKLAAGISFNQYVVSYGERPNDYESTSNYLRKKFAAIYKQCSPNPRMFYCHMTAVTDVKSTHHILDNVRDMVVRHNLRDGSLV